MAKLIGTAPNQVPTNADLGTMAYLDYDAIIAPLGTYTTSGLYSYWDVSSGDSYSGLGNTLFDLAGNQNLTNSGDIPDVRGYVNAKYFSQSAGNYPYWTASNRNYGLGNVSIEMWAFTTGSTGDDYLCNFYSGTTTGQSRAFRINPILGFVGNGSSDQDQGSIATLTSNQWYQIVFTLSGYTNLVVYVNGVAVGSFTKSLNDGGGGGVNIGNTYWYGVNHANVWKGGWAISRFYTKTLSSGEVSANWDGTKKRFGL